MTAKEYLTSIRYLDIKIGQKLSELDELHEIATAIGSFDYGRDRVQTSPSGEAPYTKTAEKAAEVDAEIRALEDEKQTIIEQIRGLDDPRHIDVLYKRYAEHKNLDVIADEMGYAAVYTRELHGSALRTFATTYTILHLDVLQ